jgi:hypothetical protein
MQDHYFDFNTLKQDLIEAIEGMDPNDPGSSEAILEMYNIMRDQGGYGIKLYHNEIKELTAHYKSLEEDLQSEYSEERPDAAYITSYRREMEQIKMQLMNIAKVKVQTDSGMDSTSNVTPEELVTYWLTYGI